MPNWELSRSETEYRILRVSSKKGSAALLLSPTITYVMWFGVKGSNQQPPQECVTLVLQGVAYTGGWLIEMRGQPDLGRVGL